MTWDRAMVAIDHIAAIGTLVSFPLIIAGLLGLIRERAASMRNWRKWGAVLLLVIGGAAYLIDVSDRMGWLGRSYEYSVNTTLPSELVAGQEFANQEVVLDGKIFRECTFRNVTFVYNGTAMFELSGSKIYGTKYFSSKNPAVMATALLLRGVGINPETAELHAPPGLVIEPPRHMP